MKVNKIVNEGNFEPDLSSFDLDKFNLLGYSLNEDGESYTLNCESSDKKREAYGLEIDHRVQQYKRYEILNETDKLESLAEEIRVKTNEIRNRFNTK